ncbi:hypothetical protein [Pseudomonas fluorescens]|uniref:Polysaccharide biosynthesis protein n=1 Tax=Pseudomonas fluorescens TaxID=294 RepID=A0A944DFQ9_PSEFL|nr:hypothetical protein [Pseudomonas fluorescens]MBT2294338.1 hypothetical protein [Pseudomonas fluorescens]MBT2307006.1 hypothetical protein [Pseudomonas fluorescens]MBT2316084.1 hypothetical protein [Pseudomonas fluorescens]MBT2327539.1 hypothetical protein [Pseudomonas fluorescens]MBT2342680.1 hypothetical protein [Pseudomonas fluorescens]
MNKGTLFGAGYQAINFFLLLVQAIFLPRYLGLDLYGAGLLLILPILMVGGLWEPVVQRYCIAGDGIPQRWWLSGGLFILVCYSIYLFLLLPPEDGGIVAFLSGLFFLLEYMLAIYYIAKFQAAKQYAKIFLLSLGGFLICGVVFFLNKSPWLICVFYAAYFFPVLIWGAVSFRFNDKAVVHFYGAFSDVLDAISTRLFYVLINNFYVVLVGFLYGPSKAAVLKIVISLISAFRFCNPFSIGHFYSLTHNASWGDKLKLSSLPLVFFFIGVLLVWLLLPWVSDYGIIFLGQNYQAVNEFFSDVLLGVPFYLWSPFLTIVFFRAIGWLYISLICLFALLVSSVFLYFNNVALFFVFSCFSYSLLVLSLGVTLEIRSSAVKV